MYSEFLFFGKIGLRNPQDIAARGEQKKKGGRGGKRVTRGILWDFVGALNQQLYGIVYLKKANK